MGVFAGHDIRDGVKKGRYSTPDDLNRLLAMIADRELTFYTLTGFAKAAKSVEL